MKKVILTVITLSLFILAWCASDQQDYWTSEENTTSNQTEDDWYSYAEDNDISDISECNWNSEEFINWCQNYLDEYQNENVWYTYAEDNDISDISECDNNSDDFINWCQNYLDDIYADEEDTSTYQKPNITLPTYPHQPSCSELYWIWATEDFNWDCKCRAWYVSNNGKCEDADNVCEDILWLRGKYNTSSEKCECSYWYEVYEWKCQSTSSICNDLLWYSSRYDSLSKQCECMYWYAVYNGQCQSMNSICRSKFGYSYHYDSFQNACAEY